MIAKITLLGQMKIESTPKGSKVLQFLGGSCFLPDSEKVPVGECKEVSAICRNYGSGWQPCGEYVVKA